MKLNLPVEKFINCEIDLSDKQGWEYVDKKIINAIFDNDESPFFVTILALKEGFGKIQRFPRRKYSRNAVLDLSTMALGTDMYLGHIKDDSERAYKYREPAGKVLGTKIITITEQDLAQNKELGFEDIGKLACYIKVYVSDVMYSLRQYIKTYMSNSVSIDADGSMMMIDNDTVSVERFEKLYSIDFCNNGTEGIKGCKVIDWMQEAYEATENEKYKSLLDLQMQDLKNINTKRIDCDYASELNEVAYDDEKHYATVELIRVGEWKHDKAPNGILKVTEQLIDQFVENFKIQYLGEKIPLDFGHNDDTTQTPGWIIDMEKVVENEIIKIRATLHITDVKDLEKSKSTWTKIKEGSIQYISPSIALNMELTDKDGLYNMIRAAALTNYPHIKNMEAIRPINFEEVILKQEDTEMNLKEIQAKLDAGKINLEEAIELFKSIVALEEISNDERIELCSKVFASAEIKLENKDLETAQAKVTELEESIKANAEKITNLESQLEEKTNLINNSEDEKTKQVDALTATLKDKEVELGNVKEQLPKSDEIVISKADYIDFKAGKKELEGNVKEMIVGRVNGNTKSEIDSSFDSEVKFIDNIKEMVSKGSSNSKGTPAKGELNTGIDLNKYLEKRVVDKINANK